MKRLLIMLVLFGQVLVTSSALATVVLVDFRSVTDVDLTLIPIQIPSLPSAAGPVNFSFDSPNSNVTAKINVTNNGISGTNDKTSTESNNWLNGVITADFSTTNTGLAGDLLFNYVLSGMPGPDLQAIQIDFYLGRASVKHVDISSVDTSTGSFQLINTGLYFDTITIQATPSAGTYQFNNIRYDAVPEPSTYALLVISLGVVGYARKRMNSKEV